MKGCKRSNKMKGQLVCRQWISAGRRNRLRLNRSWGGGSIIKAQANCMPMVCNMHCLFSLTFLLFWLFSVTHLSQSSHLPLTLFLPQSSSSSCLPPSFSSSLQWLLCNSLRSDWLSSSSSSGGGAIDQQFWCQAALTVINGLAAIETNPECFCRSRGKTYTHTDTVPHSHDVMLNNPGCS